MLIQNVQVKNFRSILNESLPCDSLTALVGRNGSGKSSFLNAPGSVDICKFEPALLRVQASGSCRHCTGKVIPVRDRRFWGIA